MVFYARQRLRRLNIVWFATFDCFGDVFWFATPRIATLAGFGVKRCRKKPLLNPGLAVFKRR